MKFVLAATCLVAFLATNCLTQEADKLADNQEPLKLELVFSDDFGKDTRDSYTIKGDVAWEKGRLKLSKGAAITHEINGGLRAKVKLRVELPALTKEEPESELRIWFVLAGETNCYVRLSRRLSGSGPIGSVALVDPGQKNGNPIVRQAVLPDQDFENLSVEYRHGLVQVVADNTPALTAYIPSRFFHGIAVVQSTTVETARATDLLSLVATRSIEHETKKLSEQGKQRLREANAAERELSDLFQQAEFTQAIEAGEMTLQIRRHVLGDKHLDYAASLNNLGLVYRSMGDYERAAWNCEHAIDITKSIVGNQHPYYARGLNHLATIYLEIGDYVRAEPLIKQAMDIRKSVLGDKHAEYATSLFELASLYVKMGDYARALPLLKLTVEINKSVLGQEAPEYATSLLVPAAEYASSLLGLASLYVKTGEFELAKPLYEQAINIYKSEFTEQHPAYAGSLAHLALLHIDKMEYELAEPLVIKAMDIIKSTLGDHNLSYARFLIIQAQLYTRMGDYARAERLCRQAINIEKSVIGEKHPQYAVQLHNLAGLYASMGDYLQAEPLLQEAIEIARENLDRNSIVQSERQQKLNQCKESHFLEWWLANAVRFGGRADRILETQWRWKGAVTIRQQAYRKAAANPKQATLFADLQSVSRQLSSLSGHTPIPPPKSAKLARQAEYKHKRDLWEERFATLNRKRENLEQQIAANNEEFRELLEPLTAVNVRDLLPARTALVDFLRYDHPSPDPDKKGGLTWQWRYIAFVVRKDHEPVMIELGPGDSIDEAINAFRRQFVIEHNTFTNLETASKAGRKLRDQLWAPIEKYLDGIETVVCSPDTALGTLPWAALPGRKANSFLLEDYKLASVPFANLLPGLMREKSPVSNDHGLLVLGDVDYNSELKSQSSSESKQLFALVNEKRQLNRTRGDKTSKWSSLPGFGKELETVKSLHVQRYGSDSIISTLSGTNATKESFLRSASRYRTLHLITHGYFEDPSVKSIDQADTKHDNIMPASTGPDPYINTWMPGLLSGLVMAGANVKSEDPEDLNDGILRASEIEAASFQGVDLVVLSACETGLGAVAGGEGLTGLQRAFQIAGARTVVASLWKVEDRATHELMRRFYENLWIKKMSKIDALREAQLWMLRHPLELEAMGVNNAQTRGEPRDLKPTETNPVQPNTSGKSDPYFWAAFQLSGDWR